MVVIGVVLLIRVGVENICCLSVGSGRPVSVLANTSSGFRLITTFSMRQRSHRFANAIACFVWKMHHS